MKMGEKVRSTHEDPRSGKKKEKYHHGDLRRDLLRVAGAEIARSGASSLSLSSVARLAGVSQPAPYRHFADRDALLAGVAEEGFEEFNKVLAEAVAGRAPQGALEAMARAYLDYGEANIELYRLMFASRLVPEAEPDSPLAKAADKAFHSLRSVMVEIAPAKTAERDAVLLWAQLHGLVMLKADGFVTQPLSEFLDLRDFSTEANPFGCSSEASASRSWNSLPQASRQSCSEVSSRMKERTKGDAG